MRHITLELLDPMLEGGGLHSEESGLPFFLRAKGAVRLPDWQGSERGSPKELKGPASGFQVMEEREPWRA